MTPTRATAYVALASVLVAWFAGAAGLTAPPPARQEPRRSPVSAGVQALAADVQAQTERLRHRLASAPAPQEPLRNPFDFASRAPARRAIAGGLAPTDLPPAAPQPAGEPVLQLIGVAERQVSGALVRTAVITADSDEPFMLLEGETLGARYRVSSVGADVVELIDLVTGATRRLSLR